METEKERESNGGRETERKSDREKAVAVYQDGREGAKGKNHGVGGTVDVTVWRVAGEERAEGGRGRGSERHCKRRTRERVAAMGEKIDILIGQNNWNERTNGRS